MLTFPLLLSLSAFHLPSLWVRHRLVTKRKFVNLRTTLITKCLLVQLEGPQLIKHGFGDAIAKVGLTKFVTDLFWVGMFYHLYNQVCPFYFQEYKESIQTMKTIITLLPLRIKLVCCELNSFYVLLAIIHAIVPNSCFVQFQLIVCC